MPLDAALAPFKIHLDEVRNCVAFMKASNRLQSSLGKVINWELKGTYEVALATSFVRLDPLQFRPVLNGLFVTAVAAFEDFLRSVIIVVARQKVQRSKTFHELGQSFINRHMEYSGRLLATVNSPPAHLSVDYYDLCRRLGTCLPDSKSVEINETALSFIRGVTEIETFVDCINALGYRLQLDDLSRDKELQKLLGTKKARETSKELRNSLREVVQNRHKIAHSGQSYAELTEAVFSSRLDLLELTAVSIVTHLKKG
ncbi:MAG: HEPN domain-containing protein [Syntrophorhabdales bacterium]|jgi:hypothetical protein